MTSAVTISAEPGLRSTTASMSGGRRNKLNWALQQARNVARDGNTIGTIIPSIGRMYLESDFKRRPTSPPGVIGAAVIKAARRSARLRRRTLSRMLGMRSATIRAWEKGTTPLFCVEYSQICRLADALKQAGAQVGTETAELVLASQCDLLVTGMLDGFEDYAEVPPIDEDGTVADAARELLRWALTGRVPERCRPHASPSPLLKRPDIAFFALLARQLQADSRGHDLASYGAALVALTAQ